MSDEAKYAVLAEKKDYDKRLYLHHLSFETLVEEVVIPYEEGKPFFIDGVPVTKDTLQKIKLIKQAPSFGQQFDRLYRLLNYDMDAGHRIPVQDYPGRLDAMFRSAGTDITTSLIAAYHEKKKLNLPKDQLISGIFSLAAAGIKTLGS